MRYISTFLAASLALLASVAPHANAANRPAEGAESAVLWTDAIQGTSLDPLSLFEAREIPETLRDDVDRFRENIAKRERDREARIAEVHDELDGHLEAGEIRLALNSAIELEALSLDSTELLSSATITDLVKRAEAAAHTAEDEERWLDAHGLFYRLNLLYSDSDRYRDDAERLAKRLILLGLYTPRRLHELNNAARLAEGEDELPPFNDSTDDWSERLKGIEDVTILRAILQAENKHINRTSFATMSRGGLESLRLLATTTDLASVFPSIDDEQKRDEFIAFIDEAERELDDAAARFDFGDTRRMLRQLRSTNRRTIDVPDVVLLHEFGNGAIGELDEFSSLVWPYETERLSRTTEGNFKGVGIQITLDEQQQLKVVAPLFGTPAYRVGLKPDDFIRKIDGESTQGITVSQSIERITGEEGTTVTLSIEREGVEGLMDFDIVRDVIDIHTVRGWERSGPDEQDWDWFIDPESHIGYIRLMEFGKDSSTEILRAVQDMKQDGLEGLILDLRYNRGGLLDEAVDIVGFWEESAIVVTQEDAVGEVQAKQRTRGRMGVLQDVPTVVLISGGSASASEIVAGALQDYGKALVVGERSYGKGSVQVVFSLGGDALFRLTTQYYRLPGGRLIHRSLDHEDGSWGVEPDVAVEILPEQLGDSLTTRMQADIVEFDATGNMIDNPDRPRPGTLITDGIDPQLEAALLLLQTKVTPMHSEVVEAPGEVRTQ